MTERGGSWECKCKAGLFLPRRRPQGFQSHHVINMSLHLVLHGDRTSQEASILIGEMGMTHTRASWTWEGAVCKWTLGDLEGREH